MRKKPCSTWRRRADRRRISRFQQRAGERHQQRRRGVQKRRQDGRRRDGVPRPRQEARRAAPVRSGHPGRPAVDGKDVACHQHRVQRGQSVQTAATSPTVAPSPRTGRSSASFHWRCRRSSSPPGILAEQTGVSSDRIRRGEISREDFDKFVQASHRLEALPLFIDDTPALGVSSLRTRARRLMRQQGLGLIVVDYLQLSAALRAGSHPRKQGAGNF